MDVETKANGGNGPLSGLDLNGTMYDFLNAFEEFKSANDQRFSELEGKAREDVLTTHKVDRLNHALDEQKAAIDRLVLEAKRPLRGGREELAGEPSGRKQAFERYMRTGDSAALLVPEGKSFSAGVDADGGFLAPEETERLISAAVRDVSPIRQIASVRQIGANTFRKPISISGAAAGWVGETEARPETATPTLAAVDFPTMELYAMPATTQSLLDDSVVNIEQFLADEVQTEFAAQEGAAFINGDGVNRPRGFLSYPIVADSGQNWGSLGYVATGEEGSFGSNPVDRLIDLAYAPAQAFRANGSFVMNRSVVSSVRKFKDVDGNYLWQPSMQAGTPATLLGYPVLEAEDMPDVSSDSHSVAFGDFGRGYLIVDRVGLRILRDPFSAKPYVLFYTTKRVGGGVQNFNAIKVLKFSTN